MCLKRERQEENVRAPPLMLQQWRQRPQPAAYYLPAAPLTCQARQSKAALLSELQAGEQTSPAEQQSTGGVQLSTLVEEEEHTGAGRGGRGRGARREATGRFGSAHRALLALAGQAKQGQEVASPSHTSMVDMVHT